ncbi:hypothetical protein ACFTWF_20275 [Rhodococcus sp. NPDC056960]|uniref:hypothetical protein n=1 Tax=Rhodococcus sp. NPDC056960 TaxID=3345982 RepID=UPI00362F4A6C
MSTLAAFTRPVAVAALFAAPAAASAAPFMPDAQVTYLNIGQAPDDRHVRAVGGRQWRRVRNCPV